MAELLDLSESARITSVNLLPSSEDVAISSAPGGDLTLHVAADVSDLGVVAGLAAAAHLPGSLIVLSGVQNAGDWFALLEPAADSPGPSATPTHQFGILRALDVVGLGVGRLHSHPLEEHALLEHLHRHGQARTSEWTGFDVAFAMMINLWTHDLSDVVRRAEHYLQSASPSAGLRESLVAQMADWAQKYDGPE
ncbi:hypothetical protein RDV89_00925 [Nocardioides zeae]|uniref:Uncharacterized protein n=1 Tax=Nocardioides imazamoxiresistens TaxID=3231893 RepID=A0ABU3PQV6_9ACTN|nr:hypothetical protein [Nocardioides zeae]MDT9591609.1 hypothetical protein [Nocardioides zeae]